MKSKLVQGARLLTFNRSVISSISVRSSLFVPDKLDMAYPTLTPEEIDEGIVQLQNSLPSDEDLSFRGTEGTKEVMEAMTTDCLGWSSAQRKKTASTDIVEYTEKNESSCFLSTSPCKQTVKPYAAGISLIPTRGFIWVMGLSKMYTVPHKHAFLNPEMFDIYALRKNEPQGSPQEEGYRSITNTVANNNEITIIVGRGGDGKWALKVSEDVMKLVQVRGPGKILGRFMPSDEILHVQDWTNPGFRKRVWSLEVFFSVGDTLKDYDGMNARARDFGSIGKDERLFTFLDGCSVVDSEELEELNANYSTTKTHRVTKVHKDIPIGDKKNLTQCIIEEIKSTQKLEELPRTDSSHTI
ncbi:Uncharacterised protein [Legionella steigerwaltii]|uniref:Uncharacterized protein n=1 Tax=Legionella steigerwaltii TaxID=460 RepID=A0A378L8V6_9GAMM|nr:hypothetical protein [Legionella steigerwaltii]KTD80799.1 hypothetical protein Lstg_0026 [Legionella steigerwaltii]STY23515.1 Uncharacterised protein [Legionella steigerwaltii]